MKQSKHIKIPESTIVALANALVVKKEIKSRVQSGESIRKVAQEKGLKVVLPL